MSIESKIKQKLTQEFQPSHLEVINESHLHNVPPNSESHFKVIIVAGAFSNRSRVQRHQDVFAVLKDEMAGGVHALALHARTLQEWLADPANPSSPKCLGGSKVK